MSSAGWAAVSSYPAPDAGPLPALTFGPCAHPFYRVAENFAIALHVANVDSSKELSLQFYVNLQADLLSVGLPDLGALVLPREWDGKFDTRDFPMLGIVVWRDLEIVDVEEL
jgi:hypothetical protein